MANQERYVFNVEWYDSAAALIRPYNFFYYPGDSTMEMYDIKQKRMFLKRCEIPSITVKDLFIGSIITVFARQIKLLEYGDVYTRSKLEITKGKTFAMVKPDAYNNIGKIVDAIEKSGFNITNLKMTKFTIQDAQELYEQHRGKPYYEELCQHVCSDFVVGMELIADDCIAKWRNMIGPTNPQQARNDAPNSIRAIFGESSLRNCVHGSDSPQAAQRELTFFFGDKSKLTTTAFFNNCTCCVIKPHILNQRQSGQILDLILQEGFEISALQMFTLDRPTAEEFLEVYKGVVPEYGQLAEQLTTGPCLALEVRQENVVESFRQLCGPSDPDLSKIVRKNTIRSKFGTDKVRNAVHCTDLAEDGIIEVEYFFNILQQKA